MRNLILYLWLCLPLEAFAQTPHPWELGIGLGTATHYGETNNIQLGKPIFGFNPAYTLHFRKNLHNHWSARLNLLYTQLSGADEHYSTPAWRQIRGLSFTGSLFEFAALAEYYPLGMYQQRGKKRGNLSTHRKSLAPFVALGLGGNIGRPSVSWNDGQPNEYVDPILAKIDKEQPNKPDLSLPLGIGIRFKTNDRLTLGLESILSLTLNDYLDGISVVGDPGTNDWFFSIQATASYAFGNDPNKSKSANRRDREKAAEENLPDSDSDSVPDEKDECPNVPGLRGLKGCPDADHDGVPDKDDQCPELIGPISSAGCPDLDEDGIPDKDDHCPETKGVLSYKGCPAIDRDKDGISDAVDLCPDMSGEARWKGCPDTDSDGLPDNKDGCPGISGPESLKGCPDTDLDGIADKDDECPTIKGLLEKKGCPEILPPALGVPYKAVYFGSTLEEWHTTSMATLNEVVNILNSDPAMFARLEGHTDNTGREPANDLLSEKRAQKCLDYLISKGIDAKRLNYLGFGSQRPIVPNTTQANKQLNRRVEVYFYKK